MMNTSRKRVIDLDLSIIDYPSALTNIIALGRSRNPSYVCFSNVHMTMEAHASKDFQGKVNASTFSFADGMPLVFALRLLYGIRQDRVAGMDVMEDLISRCSEEQLSVFFYGSTPEVLDAIQRKIRIDHPHTQIAGMISPPFRSLSEAEQKSAIDQINNSGANLVLVGLGCPKQETWMAENFHQINACLLGVGGAFEVFSGQKKRAPAWVRSIGMEWFFRLILEPRRLLKRYLITNTLFIYYFFTQLLSPKK